MSIDSTKFSNLLSKHMQEQPVETICARCGNALDITGVNVDDEFDLSIKVWPCKNCTKED
jgi:hypothetical protein